jgi:signal transduction histidine kinase
VLREVSLQVGQGEIVAVAGGNGAGKSTLIGTIAGVLDADAGDVRFDGRPMPSRPRQVRRAGIETVWQEHGLCDDLDAVANIFLGRPGRWVIPESALREQAAALLSRVGARDLRLDVPLRVLSRGQRQLVAVARALLTPPRLLVMDEPTASLGVAETALVELILREARDAGASVLESLAGPERLQGGLEISLLALLDGLGADTAAVMAADGEPPGCRCVAGESGPGVRPGLAAAATAVLSAGEDVPARLVEPGLAAGSLRLPGQRGALVAWWSPGKTVTEDALELLDDASRSLALAMERESLETARREAAALRRSQSIQRDMLSSLSHELRTPLTAIRGYASTLCQPDLTWNPEATRRFLGSIAAESARMERLVGDLLDSTAIESGVLRLQRDWCDLALVVSAAANCLSRGPAVRIYVTAGLEPVWADHDRLEQVFVNLLENAASHGASPRGTDVTVRAGGPPGWAEVEITDYGAGIPAGLAGKIFEPRVRGTTEVAGTGLGLPIARGIVEAHGGTLVVAPADPGASFVVALPADPPPGSTGEPAGASWSVVEEPEEVRGG